MKKLLLLSALGLALGGGIWKAQNPEGTLDDLKAQAGSTFKRVQAGVDAGFNTIRDAKPQLLAEQLEQSKLEKQALEDRIAKLETIAQQQSAEPSVIELATELAALEAKTTELLAASSPTEIPTTASPIAETGQNNPAESVLAEHATQLDALGASLDALGVSQEASTVRFNDLDEGMKLLIQRLDEQSLLSNELEARISDVPATAENLQAINTTLAELQAAIDEQDSALDDTMAELNDQTKALSLRLDTLALNQTPNSEQDNASTAASVNTGIDERFSVLEERLQTVNSDSRRLSSLSEQLASLRDEIGEIKQQIATNDRTVASISDKLETLETVDQALSIDTVQAEIRDQLALAQSQFESNQSPNNSEALEDLLNATRNRIQTLEQQVSELPASSSEASDAQQIQSVLEAQIASLEKRLESLNNMDPEIANALSSVKEQVDQLASREFVTQEDLRANNQLRSVEYKIYFDRNSAEITADAAVVLNSFITQEKNRTVGVSIFGFTDRRGPATYNQQLALQRATNVRSYLIQNGLDYTKIKTLTGLGEDAAAAVLPDNAEDAQQRVVVLYSAQP